MSYKLKIRITAFLSIILTLSELLFFLITPQFGRSILDYSYQSCTYDKARDVYVYQYGKNHEIEINADSRKNAQSYSVTLSGREAIVVNKDKITDTMRKVTTDTLHYSEVLNAEAVLLLSAVLNARQGLSAIPLILLSVILLLLNTLFLTTLIMPEKILKHRSFIKKEAGVEYFGILLYRLVSGICIIGLFLLCIRY